MLLDGSLAGRDVCALSMTGIAGEHPPAEPEALLESARSLPAAPPHQGTRGRHGGRRSSRCPAGLRRLREWLARSGVAGW